MHSTDIQWSAILSWGYADNILRLKSKQSEPPVNFIQSSHLHQVCPALTPNTPPHTQMSHKRAHKGGRHIVEHHQFFDILEYETNQGFDVHSTEEILNAALIGMKKLNRG